MMNRPPALLRPRSLLMLALAALSGCAVELMAPGAWNDQPDFNAFLDRIAKDCQTIRGVSIANLENAQDPSFLDATSKLYCGKMDAASYRQFITSFSADSPDSYQAVDCIVAHLPSTPPPTPSLVPDRITDPFKTAPAAPPPPGSP